MTKRKTFLQGCNTTTMKLIIFDGGPASGKSTLGALLTEKFCELGNKAILLDLDTYVEELNPKWIWTDNEKKKEDLLKARHDYLEDIRKYLQNDFIVIAIGERFSAFLNGLTIINSVYLFHLRIPFSLRNQRMRNRGQPLIDLGKDQKDRDEVKVLPGYLYENVNSPEEDMLNLLRLIQTDQGLVNIKDD